MREIHALPTKEIQPIFIMGCQRSGTTMLASQLGAAQNAIAYSEMQFVQKLVNENFRRKHSAEQAYRYLFNDFRFKSSGITLDKSRFIAAYEDQDISKAVQEIVLSGLKSDDSQNKLFWIEHNPHNRDSVLDLLAAFPNAKFIHVYRDPRAIYYSMKSNPRWTIGDPMRFSSNWVKSVAKCYFYQNELSQRCIEVKYEDYVLDCENQLKRLCDFIGLTFEKEMMQGGGVFLPNFTKKQHAFTSKPVEKSRIEVWKDKLTPFETEIINSACFDWMKHYGYLNEGRTMRHPSKKEKIIWTYLRIEAFCRAKLVTFYQNKKSLLSKAQT